MRLYFRYILIFLILINKWIPVESSESSDGTSTKTGVDLNLTSEASTTEFDYNKDGDHVTYTAKGNHAFKSVKDGSDTVWETSDSSEYSAKIEFETSGEVKSVTIHMGDKAKIFIKDASNEPWIEIHPDKINPKSVNIKDDKETYFYTNKVENNIRTFEAQEGFAFSTVNEGSGANKVEIWKTTNENEYSKKVEVEGDNKVTIHIGDDSSPSTKLFNKGSDGTWNQDGSQSQSSSSSQVTSTPCVSSPPASSTSITGGASPAPETSTFSSGGASETCVNVKGATSNLGGSGSSESTTSCGWSCCWDKIKGWVCGCFGSCGRKGSTKSTSSGSSETYEKIKGWSESHCSSCSWDTIKGWLCCRCCGSCGSSGSSGSECSKSCMWDWVTGLCGNSCTSSSSSPGELNINSEKSNDNIDCKKVGTYATYTAKGSNLFDTVKDDKTEVWATSDTSQRSNKVEVDIISKDAKAVTIYLPDNKTKVFKKDGKDKPWNEIDTSKVNPISFDIKNQYNTYLCSITSNNNVRTFESRKGFIFNGVREENSHIWATTNENEYAKKIVVEGENKVTIHIGDGTSASTKVFNKGDDGNWTEEGSG